MPRKLLAVFAFLSLTFGTAMADVYRAALASEDADEVASQSVAEESETQEEPPTAGGSPASSEETPAASGEASEAEEAPALTDAPSAEEASSQAETPAASEEADSASTEESTAEARDALEAVESNIGGSLVQVLVMGRNDEVRRVGSGFVVGAGHVLTAAHLVSANRRVFVVPLSTKAELRARVLQSREGADLALLGVNGLDLAPLIFAKDGFAPGRIVLSAGVWREDDASFLVTTAEGDVTAAFAQGSVGRHSQLSLEGDSPALTLIQHNAMIPVAGYGGPLLNNCGEVVGINRGSPNASGSWFRRPQAPEDVVYALEGIAVVNLLRLAGVTVGQSEESCVDARVDAEAAAAAARRELEEARREAELALEREREASGQAEEKEEQLQQRQDELEDANARVSDLQERIRDADRRGEEAASLREDLQGALEDKQQKQAELERLRTEVEDRERKARGRLLMTLAFAVAAVALVAIVAFTMHRRRSHQLAVAQDQAARAQREAQRRQVEGRGPGVNLPDCVLAGETGDGKSVSLKIPGSMLDGGVVIGRSPRNSTFLIDDKTLSREHAKLFADRDRLCIEDLGTTNGTRVNGRDLSPNDPVSVRGGNVLELGAVRLRVTWKN